MSNKSGPPSTESKWSIPTFRLTRPAPGYCHRRAIIAADTSLKAGIDVVGYHSKRQDQIDWDPDDSTMQVISITIGGTQTTTKSKGDAGGKSP